MFRSPSYVAQIEQGKACVAIPKMEICEPRLILTRRENLTNLQDLSNCVPSVSGAGSQNGVEVELETQWAVIVVGQKQSVHFL